MPSESDSISGESAHPFARPRRTFLSGLENLLLRFSPAERLALYAFSLLLALSAFVLVGSANELISTEVPTDGGTIVEGAVGTPRFVNPLLATTPADEDLTMLVYSGLLRISDTGFAPDLASSYDISDDGTTYTFNLREGLTFHDGTPLNAEDVLYTIARAQDPDVKSPRRADWDGVSVTAPDDRTVVFTLPHPYSPFLENATIGILPKEHWENTPASEFPFSSLNTHPIGSGPYEVQSVELDATGAPTEYRLRAFANFTLGKPHITTITYRLFPTNEDLMLAVESGDVETFVASSPKTVAREVQAEGRFMRIPLTRIFAIFLNQNHAPVLADAAAREALAAAIDTNALVEQVLGGFGTAIDGPLPAGVLSVASSASSTEGAPADRAREILTEGGWSVADATATSTSVWTKGSLQLTLTLATPDTPELVASAEMVAAAWNAIGIPAEVQVYPLTEFNQTILRPRSYDAILFGEVVGRSLDLYPFWHSSQRNDPGLNFSLYTNAEADRALAAARAESDRDAREAHVREFLALVSTDAPAIFLYSPETAYRVPSYLEGISLGPVTIPAERFAGIHTWYRDTERVWDFFNTSLNK